MEAIEFTQRPQNGQITIDVPDEMRDESVIIRIEKHNGSAFIQVWSAHDDQMRVATMNRRKGRLKDKSYPIDKYDVYNQ